MKSSFNNPWCMKCRKAFWIVSEIDGVRVFRCPCHLQFREVNTRSKSRLNKIQDARWMLAGGMGVNEIARRLHCHKSIVMAAVEQYGRLTLVKSGPKQKAATPVSEVWPYGNNDPFTSAVNEALPRTISEEVRSEIGQEMVTAMMSVMERPAQFIRQYYQRQGFNLSLDAEPKYYAALAG